MSTSGNNFTGEIPSSFGNLTSLNELRLTGNSFSGVLPPSIGNLTALTILELSANNLTGEIPNEFKNLTNIRRLLLGGNNLYGNIPVELANFQNLEFLSLGQNNFNFFNLEPLASADLSKIGYSPQRDIILERATINGKTELEMKAGGEKTTYKWYYANVEVPDENKNKFTVPSGNEIAWYRCKASNSMLPNLVLRGIPPENDTKSCWQTGELAFCIYGGEWEGLDGENKIKSSNKISINDFLFFEGSMIIDTMNLGIEANGEFYADNIPIPGGGNGKYTILEGEHNLKLIGSEGKIMDFLNSNLSKTASLFGAELKVDELQFFKRQDTTGVKLGCSAHIPWVSNSCGTPGIYTPGVDLKLKNLEITNKGIMSAGFEAENIGLFKEDYCLNKIDYEYNFKRNILTAGADISLPFFADVGGGFRLEKGKIDSVAWSVEGGTDVLPTAPIGFGTLGVKGFYGHISGLNQPEKFNPAILDIKFGGIFSDVTSDKWYQITADGRTMWPKLFEFSGTGKLLKPSDDFPYQIKGDIKAEVDVSNKLLKIDYNGNFLTMNEQTWLATGSGGYTINQQKEKPEAEGYFSGTITLPEISSYWPFNWFNSKEFGTYMRTFNENLNIVHGILYYYPIPETSGNPPVFKLPFIINTEKEVYETGYLRFPEDSRVDIAIEVETKSGGVENSITENILVPENSQFGVVEIKSQSNAPVSTIISPSGQIFSETSLEDKIIYHESEDNKAGFWSLLAPEAGNWQISIENPENNDSIISHFKLNPKDFNFTMNQTDNVIYCEWNVNQIDSGQVINFMLDDDNADFDGFRLFSADATKGAVSFTLNENYPDCSYYLYAQLYDEDEVKEIYADEKVENYQSTLVPPENFAFEYNNQTGIFDFSWDSSPSSDVVGYILSVTDIDGRDSVYAVLDKGSEGVSLSIENYETKYPKIESYSADWRIGCAATLPGLVTAIDEKNFLNEPSNYLNIYPNPTNGNLSIKYFVKNDSKCQIYIYDINGRQIAQPVNDYKIAGFHQLNFDYADYPNGIYLIKFVNDNESFTVKSIFSR